MDQAPMSKHSIDKPLSIILGELSLMYILGLISSLYVTFPDTTNQKTLMDFSWTQWPVAAHIVLGVLVILEGLIILYKAVKSKNKMFLGMAIAGFIAVAVAGFGGDMFVRTQKDMYTLVMGIGFIAAMGLYGRLLAAVLVAKAKG